MESRSCGRRAGQGPPVFRPASRPAGMRVPPPEPERGDGLERRPLVGIARERETSVDGVAACQRECRATFFATSEGVQEDPLIEVSPDPARYRQTRIGETAWPTGSLPPSNELTGERGAGRGFGSHLAEPR